MGVRKRLLMRFVPKRSAEFAATLLLDEIRKSVDQGKLVGATFTRGGGGTSLWVRRGCAPVLGSFWPENSGIGVSFYWKISVIGVYFHSEFSGIGGYSKFCNGC